ncbi:MAG: carbohydrate deacetylase [Gammaproteobacteria bacterium]
MIERHKNGRFLIVNADDFGMSRAVNRGVIEAHERGIVTSASLLVLWPGAEEAAAYAVRRPELGLGLHLDLGEWFWDDTEWRASYERVRLEDPSATAGEIERQLEAFRKLVRRDPTHLDSHQHVHQREPTRGAVLAFSKALGVPLRGCTEGIRYWGAFYGQTKNGDPLPALIAVDVLLDVLEELPLGITELACHPGADDGPGAGYRTERAFETVTLCDGRVRSAIAERGITLCSFADRRILS